MVFNEQMIDEHNQKAPNFSAQILNRFFKALKNKNANENAQFLLGDPAFNWEYKKFLHINLASFFDEI